MGEASGIARPSKQMGTMEVRTPVMSFNPPIPPQAYYGPGATPPPFVTSSSAAALVYPYMWGNQAVSQHQFMQQYGPAFQHHVLFHNERYANPNIVGGVTLTIPEKDRIPDGKDLDSTRKCKGSSENLGFVGSRPGESEKAASDSRNEGDGPSQSGASRSDGLSDESDETDGEFSATKKQRFNQLLPDGVVAQNNATVQYRGGNTDVALQDFVANTAETDLKLRMSLSASRAQSGHKEEEHDLRKERRKQSNRESAKRSRLRRQQECEKLQEVVEILSTESTMLKGELMTLSEECGKLGDENNSIMDELVKTYGPDAISNLIALNPDSGTGESNISEERTPSGDDSTPDQNRD